ncbi:Nop14-like protein [Leucogyrophana mollusca]|uniref:Nop14-like protein n=1 Tax=Leucogyrophana mollusca TaxID=85980 RepID=A0ACB8C058_9AGAM|nr:Nop14-like protein [Leucogyrophana mollusca]
MAKGSQLSQLKSALSHAGLNKQPQNGKKRKRSGTQDQDKVKKAAKLEEIHRKLNPFDVKVTKLKHDVGGRKIKGVAGRPAQSKQAGIVQRERTLLKELEERGRAGGIVDRRFGENDASMSLEERMLERFTKERQRTSRGATFNLEDEEELTHYGQSLSKLDDFDNVGLPMDDDGEDEEQGQIDRDIVKKTHFGGFDEDGDDVVQGEEEPERKKSKAEVMAEVIAKSKEHKMRRQLEREQGDNLRHQLDQDFDSLKALLYAPDPSSTGSNSIPLGSANSALPLKPSTHVVDEMDYDTQVRELAFDKRAKPKDRTKTEEEIALEEKEALEKAERQRRRRMLGQDDVGSDLESGKAQRKRKRERGGDDLDDDFDEPLEILGSGLGEEVREDESMSEVESDGSDNQVDGEDSAEDDGESGSDDDPDDHDASEGEVGDFREITTKRKTGTSLAGPLTSSKELPYIFPCPESHEEFLDIVDGIEDKDIPTVVQRIRALHHPSLGPDNKFKLQNLTTVLIDHILYITSPPSPRFALLSALQPHLFALSRSYPIESAEYFVEKISLMHKNLKRGLSQGILNADTRTWPGLSELSFLRTLGAIWPTSDMHHPVVSPARLLMGAYLALCRVRSLSDIASGLFLCSLFLQYEELSKRLVPETINFAINAVLHLAPHPFKSATSLPGCFPSPDFRSELCLPLCIRPKEAKGLSIRTPNLPQLMASGAIGEQAKVDLLSLAFHLLDRFADMYKGLDGFIELYQPIREIVVQLDFKKLPQSLQAQVTAVGDKVTRLLKFSDQARRPLLLQAHKPIPIPSYIPKFETHSSSYLRRQDPDHERNEASKLRYQVKQERKGAIRELRKDAKFLAAAEHKKQAEKDRTYKDRMNKVFSSLEGERAEQKAMDREKSREKKRAGRK